MQSKSTRGVPHVDIDTAAHALFSGRRRSHGGAGAHEAGPRLDQHRGLLLEKLICRPGGLIGRCRRQRGSMLVTEPEFAIEILEVIALPKDKESAEVSIHERFGPPAAG